MRSRWQYTPTSSHTAAPVATAEPIPTPVASPAPAPTIPSLDASKDARWAQLVELIAKLPPDKAEQLRAMLGADSLVLTHSAGFGQVLQALELRRSGDRGPAAGEPLMRRVCQLLEPFLIDEPDDSDTGVIRRQSLVPWWEASLAQSAALREIDETYRRAAAAKVPAEMERLEEEAMAELARRAKTLAFKNTAQAVIEDVRRIGIVLAGGAALARALKDLSVDGPPQAPGIELDAVLVRRFGKAYEALSTNRQFDPVWLGHAVMNHLARPWEVVTLIHRVTGCTDIQMLEQTELAPLVDRAIGQLVAVAEEAVRAIREAARGRKADQIETAARCANLYFDLAESIAREIKLERASHWGQAYMASRKQLSDLIPAKLGDFEETITDFLDDWRPGEHSRADHPAFFDAISAADFIGAMKLRAARHGFGMPFGGLERRLQDALGRPMKRPPAGRPDFWPVQKRRLLEGLRLI
ncbi:hypothetical protein GCM10011611_11490 [Aliidongia dinghuensis]|uniref:Uncharacterized protein n=1 Tax=Aliidongia dinghuensis TaxID=1867774 RepID=A0A8J2YR41_9PROT|nr:hypothetical protein [Aliidongia dinghuensis]GGF07706.1 hypothetical protein GCM10011611_11490 [Aliidongia dinghuensis]